MNKVQLSQRPDLMSFLSNQAAATLAVAIDGHGTIHVAALLFYHTEDPLAFYFVTSRDSEKVRKLDGSIPAGLVVGTERSTDFTLQMRGELSEKAPAGADSILVNYYAKRGNRDDDISEPINLLLEFKPSWARFTDYSKGYEHHYLDLEK